MGKITKIAKKNKYQFLNYTIAFFFFATPIESIALLENFSIAKFSALLVLLGWATQGFKFKTSKMLKRFGILAIYASLTIFWSIDSVNSTNQILMFLFPSLIVAAAMNYSISKEDDIYLYLKAYIMGCLVSTISTFMLRDTALAMAEYAGQERLTAFGQDQNTLAFFLCVGLTIILDHFRKTSKVMNRVVSILIIVALVIVILSTGSRTGLVLTLFVLFMYFLSSGNANNVVVMILLVLFLAPVIYNYIPESIWERFLETNDLVESGNFSDRGDVWKAGLEALSHENFLVGVGYSNFSTMLRQHFGWQMASHNTYLSYLADLGIIGLVIFMVTLCTLFKIVWNIYKASKDKFILAYIIPFFVVMFVLETENKRWLFMYGVMFEAYYSLKFNHVSQK